MKKRQTAVKTGGDKMGQVENSIIKSGLKFERRKMKKKEKSRTEIIIDAILEGGYTEDELEEIISICESELCILGAEA